MAETFDVEQRWSDLLEGLTETQPAGVIEPLVDSRHEGRVIDREGADVGSRGDRGRGVARGRAGRRAAAQP